VANFTKAGTVSCLYIYIYIYIYIYSDVKFINE
jgi:hypothetical protein